MAIQNIALIGGTGTLGGPLLRTLQASPFTIYVLNRESSKSTYPDARVLTIPDDLNVPALTSIFKTHAIDALIIAIAGSHVEPSKRLIEAAFNSGVKRVIPAEFGSCDSADDATNAILPLMAGKKVVREYLQSLAERTREGAEPITWTSLVTGHFFDYGLASGLLRFDVGARTAYLVDGGDIKFSASDLDFIAKAVVRVMQKPEETKNRMLYVHSHYVTQNEVLAELERTTGEEWKRVPQNSEEELKVARKRMAEGDREATEDVVAVWGIVASDWKEKEGFANELLDLEEGDLEKTVRRVLGK